MKTKKGAVSLEQVPAIVMILVVVAVFLSIGAMVLREMGDLRTTSFSTTVDNESGGYASTQVATNLTLANFSSHMMDFTVDTTTIEVRNETNKTIHYIFTAPYSIAIFNGSELNSGFNISYTYTQTTQDTQFNATWQGRQGLQNLSEWQTIIAIVIAAAVVIGMIIWLRR